VRTLSDFQIFISRFENSSKLLKLSQNIFYFAIYAVKRNNEARMRQSWRKKMDAHCVNKLARRSAVWPIRQNFLQKVPEMYFKMYKFVLKLTNVRNVIYKRIYNWFYKLTVQVICECFVSLLVDLQVHLSVLISVLFV
jgi:hypothetical protein